MNHNQTADKETNYGHKGRPLQITEPRYRMPRSTSPSIARSKTDQQTADCQQNNIL